MEAIEQFRFQTGEIDIITHGFRITKDRLHDETATMSWRCEIKTCVARAKTDINTRAALSTSNEHNYDRSPTTTWN